MGVEETEKEPAVAQGAPEAPNGLEDPEAKRAKKAAKRERQRLKKQQQKEQQEAAEPDPFAELASRRLRVPLSSFMPSTTRRQLEQPAQKARRRRGFGGAYIEYNGMLEQVKLLQCPLVWRLRPLGPVNELYSILDSSPYCGSPWHSAVEQIQVASDFAEQRMLWKSRELLQDVYAMLEDQDVNAQKSMFRKYLPGLKHVLDATWLLVREDADARAGRRLPDGTLADDVVLFEELDDQQRACVYAIKAVMAQVDVEAADKALQLDPGEAQWHYVKWLCLRAARARKRGVEPEDLTTSTPQEEAVLRKAHELRQTPQTMVATARACLEAPRKDAEQCARLLGEAKALFPRCAYVHFHCGHLYHRLVRGKKNAKSKRDAEVKRDTQKVILSFKRAIHLSQGLWMKACLDWGMYCLENGMSHEGMYHLRKAGVLD